MGKAGEISERYFVVGRGRGETGIGVLLAREAAGWSLPRVESRADRAADVDDVAPAARARFGLDVSVLSCLADTPAGPDAPRVQVYELDVHGGAVPQGVGLAWLEPDEAARALRARPEQRDVVAAWFARRLAGDRAPRGREWTTAGWRDRVVGWAQRQLDRAGLGPIAGIEQLRVWEWSHVLRLRTPAAELYLKARPDWGAVEPRLTEYLARCHPRVMPAIVAIDFDRGWMLMRATPGRPLMDVRDPLQWTEAATALARLQIDCVGRTGDIAALGCPERPLEWLAGEVDPLLADREAMQPRDADALTDAEADRAHELGPRLRSMCAELADHGVPLSIEHGDLWATNVIASDAGCVFIDWEDAALASPFMSARLLLGSLCYTDALSHVPAARERIAAAYLAPWRERGPLTGWSAARLERAFALAQALAPLHYAVQFRRFSNPVIETSWEVRGYCPLFVRALLRGLGAGAATG